MPALRHDIRNLAIIAHVDHGKTTLVDALLKQSHTFRDNQEVGSLIMDSNPLEREKGITILAKNTAIRYHDTVINIIDTPGHADFGGEVERVLNMADGCLLLVDAAEGPMPQTRFVLRKAFEVGLRPILVINKLDRPLADAKRALDLAHDLFLELAENADQLDIAVLTGLEEVTIGDTLADPESPDPLPRIAIDEPTVKMTFGVNTSPLTGREGKFSTSRQLRARLFRELEVNLGLRVEATDSADSFLVSGRGELHLAVLIETMRREGYELEVSRPEVITKEVDGKVLEPFEHLTIDVPEGYLGAVSEALGRRRGEMVEISYGESAVRLDYTIPTRGLIGFRNTFLTITAGTGIMGSLLLGYRPWAGDFREQRNGAMTASSPGNVLAFGLANAQERGFTFVEPGEQVYEGMIVGIQKRPGDMAVNVCKEKKQTNMRSSNADIMVRLTPATRMSLEPCLTFLVDDELLEVTPKYIRLRKRHLTEVDPASATRASN